MKTVWSVLGLCTMALGIAGCDGGIGTVGLANIGDDTAAGGGTTTRTYNVLYSATGAGDGAITVVQYLDADGNQISVSNPALPWTVSVAMESGDQVSLSGSGTVTSGSLLIGLQTASSDASGTILNSTDSCASTGTSITCQLAIAPATLQ